MNEKLTWLIDRLGENSTWRGIIGILTASGVVLKPDQADKIIAAGMALVAVINIFRKAPPKAADLAEVKAQVATVSDAVRTGDTTFLTKPNQPAIDAKTIAPTTT